MLNMREQDGEEFATLALAALGWALSEPIRAQRLLDLTGLTPADLRTRIGEPAVLAAAIRFLEAHEADLVACAASLEVSPTRLVAAREALER
jgi:hypothetical protein